MQVTGYGIELAVKHTEYKAVDDVKVLGSIGECFVLHCN